MKHVTSQIWPKIILRKKSFVFLLFLWKSFIECTSTQKYTLQIVLVTVYTNLEKVKENRY